MIMNKVMLSTLVLCLCVVAANAAVEVAAAASNNLKKPIIPPLVSKVCENAALPASCVDILIAYNPGSKNADLTRLALISIKAATLNIIHNAGIVAEMQKHKILDVHESNCYKNCSDSYIGAVEALDDSLVELMKKNYALVKEKINIADRYEAICEMCFMATKQKNKMIVLNERVRNMGKNAVTVVNALQAGAKH